MFGAPILLVALAVTLPLEVVPRSPPASDAPVAQVVMAFGSATATVPAGHVVALAPGMVVDRTDTIGVATNAWVVLALLANGHLVRLDEEVTLQVSAIALLDVPTTTETAETQLERLLTQRERTAVSVPQRLIGWHAGVSAAQVKSQEVTAGEAGSSRQRAQEDEPTTSWWPPSWWSSWFRKEEGPARGETSVQNDSPRRDKAAPKRSAAPTGQGAAPAPPGQPLQKTAGEPPSTEPLAENVRAPATLATLAVDEPLRACIKTEYLKLSEATRKGWKGALLLTLRLDASGEARATLAGALPPPACVLDWARAHTAQLTRQPTQLTVQVE